MIITGNAVDNVPAGSASYCREPERQFPSISFRYDAPPDERVEMNIVEPHHAGDVMLASGEVVNAEQYLHQVY